MHKANSNMLWFVNILCKIVKSTVVYFFYFVSQALTFFCSLLFLFVLFRGLLSFILRKPLANYIFFCYNQPYRTSYVSFYHLFLFAGSEMQHILQNCSEPVPRYTETLLCFGLKKKKKESTLLAYKRTSNYLKPCNSFMTNCSTPDPYCRILECFYKAAWSRFWNGL